MRAKVLIVDDHPAVREGLAVRIATRPNLEVCGEAATPAEAMRLVEKVRPDVILVDIQLKDGDGLELVERIRAHDKWIRILVWSMYPDSLYAHRALNAGAMGYINKEHSTEQIIEAIDRILDGKIYLSEEIAQRLLIGAVRGAKRLKATGIESLSDRELEVFRLIGQGLSSSHIARRLHRSPHTVEAHRQRIKSKLNLESSADVLRAAVQWMLDKK
jgi:DNA-binding NarL/FixJ family response regulator